MYTYMYIYMACLPARPPASVPACLHRKGTNEVSTNGVTANCMFFDRGTFWVLPLTYSTFIFPKVPGGTFFPNLTKSLLLQRLHEC